MCTDPADYVRQWFIERIDSIREVKLDDQRRTSASPTGFSAIIASSNGDEGSKLQSFTSWRARQSSRRLSAG